MLVLSGIVVGSLLGAGVGLVKILADPYDQLPAMTFWLLGSLAGTTAARPPPLLGPVAVGIGRAPRPALPPQRLSLPEEEARALGLPTGPLRAAVIAAATLVTAASVAAAGVIGWIGLVVPHLARFLVGPDFGRLAARRGAARRRRTSSSSTRWRGRWPGSRCPLGILTAVVGTPFFLWLLASGRKGWS